MINIISKVLSYILAGIILSIYTLSLPVILSAVTILIFWLLKIKIGLLCKVGILFGWVLILTITSRLYMKRQEKKQMPEIDKIIEAIKREGN